MAMVESNFEQLEFCLCAVVMSELPRGPSCRMREEAAAPVYEF